MWKMGNKQASFTHLKYKVDIFNQYFSVVHILLVSYPHNTCNLQRKLNSIQIKLMPMDFLWPQQEQFGGAGWMGKIQTEVWGGLSEWLVRKGTK